MSEVPILEAYMKSYEAQAAVISVEERCVTDDDGGVMDCQHRSQSFLQAAPSRQNPESELRRKAPPSSDSRPHQRLPLTRPLLMRRRLEKRFIIEVCTY